MANYSIKDLEHLSGIKAHTLRIWEQRYNFINPKRTDTNIRYYDDHDLKLILNISLLKDNGHKISKLSSMSEDQMRNEVVKLTEKKVGYPEQVQALTLAMLDLDEERFDKVLSMNILQLGFERTVLNILHPFLARIGVLWQTGSINPAHEHFISNLIRQKIISAIDSQIITSSEYNDTYLLFLPEGELHEISLLISSYLLKARKHKVIYIGPNLPLGDLKQIVEIVKPGYFLSVFTSQPTPDRVQSYIDELAKTYPNVKILLSGAQIVGQGIEAPNNVVIMNKLQDLIDFATPSAS